MKLAEGFYILSEDENSKDHGKKTNPRSSSVNIY